MRDRKQRMTSGRVDGLCRPCWRVWVAIRGRPHIKAVADIIDVPTAEEASTIVMSTWTKEDWDPEAFAYLNRAGNWRYYRLRDRDQIVLERVEAAHDS